MALISTFSTKATGLRYITTDRFTYGSSFNNFNLPQFYQIVKVDGREQVIPFRTKSIGNMPPANQDHDTPLLQQYFS